MPPFNRSLPVNYGATDDLSPRGLSFGHGWNRAGHRIASFTPRRLDQTEREKRWTHRAGTARRVPRPYVQSPTLGLMLCISPPLVNRGSCVRLAIQRFLCRLDRCQSSGRARKPAGRFCSRAITILRVYAIRGGSHDRALRNLFRGERFSPYASPVGHPGHDRTIYQVRNDTSNYSTLNDSYAV